MKILWQLKCQKPLDSEGMKTSKSQMLPQGPRQRNTWINKNWQDEWFVPPPPTRRVSFSSAGIRKKQLTCFGAVQETSSFCCEGWVLSRLLNISLCKLPWFQIIVKTEPYAHTQQHMHEVDASIVSSRDTVLCIMGGQLPASMRIDNPFFLWGASPMVGGGRRASMPLW